MHRESIHGTFGVGDERYSDRFHWNPGRETLMAAGGPPVTTLCLRIGNDHSGNWNFGAPRMVALARSSDISIFDPGRDHPLAKSLGGKYRIAVGLQRSHRSLLGWI